MLIYASAVTCSQSRFGVVARPFEVKWLKFVDVTGILENKSVGCVAIHGNAESENMSILVLEPSC